MSGYLAMVRFDDAPLDLELFGTLAATLQFRGPDRFDVVNAPGAAFAHALLATSPEAERETQPLRRGDVTFAGDVRVDARDELTRTLRAHGCDVAAGVTDPELVLHAWSVWGEATPEHVIGDYSFALWDAAARRLVCVRDRFARRAAYYAFWRGSLLVTNNLPALLACGDLAGPLDERAIADFLLFGRNYFADRTTFANIRRVPAAHVMTATEAGIDVRRYWSIPQRDAPRRIREDDAYAEFRDVFSHAVADRARADRVVISLSGGLDSNAVASVLMRVRGPQGVSAITSAWSNVIEDDEARIAAVAASSYGIPLETHIAARCEPFEGWSDPRVRGLEPTDEPCSAPFFEFAHRAAALGRVILTGEGGDAVLYASHDYFFRLLKRLRLVRMAWEAGSYALTRHRRPPLNLRSQLRRAFGRPPQLPDYPAWIDPDLERRLDLRARWLEVLDPKTPPAHAYRADAWRLIDSPSWSRTFEAEDPGATGEPIEWASPCFDVRVVEFLFSLPPMPYFANKEIVRGAMRGWMPEAIRRRPKTALRSDPSALLFTEATRKTLELVAGSPALDEYVKRPILCVQIGQAGGSDYERSQQAFAAGLGLWLTKHHR